MMSDIRTRTPRSLMVQGTASSVGKSLIVAALCRIFRDEGFSVAPFKAQNMALNSFVTPDGGEIGRAQAVQAESARVEPCVEMNPILLKPEGGMRSQVVVLGKSIGSMSWAEYQQRGPQLASVITESLRKLRVRHDLVIIEGAGSPVEINLAGQDLVNMRVAAEADAPVLLVGDIDRGGVFAHLAGTMELLEPADQSRVAGFLINKFRGDRALLDRGLEFLRVRYGVPVLGVIPYLERLRIAEEDSVALEEKRSLRVAGPNEVNIAVIKLPHVSNYDDFLPLEHEHDVLLRFVDTPGDIIGADLVIIPGSKSTIADLEWMKASGLVDAIVEHNRRGGLVAGICGGCQMLGDRIEDPHRVESRKAAADGLGLLPITTRFEKVKLTAQVKAHVEAASFLSGGESATSEITAYEIHMGAVIPDLGARTPFRLVARNSVALAVADGAINSDGTVVGTMLHGIFENDALRVAFLDGLRRRKGLAVRDGALSILSREAEYDRLAATLAVNLDMSAIRRIAGLQ